MNISKKLTGWSVSASGDAGFPASNLLVESGVIWKYTGSSVTLTLTSNVATSVGAIAFIRTNFESDVSILVKVYPSLSASSPSYTHTFSPLTGTDEEAPTVGVWLPTLMDCRKVVITLDGGQGVFSAEYLHLGDILTLTPPEGESVRVGNVDLSTSSRLASGRQRVEVGAMYKTLSFSIQSLPDSERDAMWRLYTKVGKHTPVLISLTPQEDNTTSNLLTVFGRFSSSTDIAYKALGVYSTDLTVEES